MAFTVEIVRNDSGLFSSGRRFGKIGLGKLAYGKCRLKSRFSNPSLCGVGAPVNLR